MVVSAGSKRRSADCGAPWLKVRYCATKTLPAASTAGRRQLPRQVARVAHDERRAAARETPQQAVAEVAHATGAAIPRRDIDGTVGEITGDAWPTSGNAALSAVPIAAGCVPTMSVLVFETSPWTWRHAAGAHPARMTPSSKAVKAERMRIMECLPHSGTRHPFCGGNARASSRIGPSGDDDSSRCSWGKRQRVR
jgi:hypothetical protein